MTIAVTAATGQLGTLVVDALLARTTPDQIVAIVRDAAKAEPLAAKGVDVRIASYDDTAALEAALAGIDRVLLISGNEFGKRTEQHRNVIDAAIANDVSQPWSTPAKAQIDTSTLPVAPEHLATEQYLASTAVDHVVLRNNWSPRELRIGRPDRCRHRLAPDQRRRRSRGQRCTPGLRRGRCRHPHQRRTGQARLRAGRRRHLDSGRPRAALSEVLGKPVELANVSADEQSAILTSAGLDAGLIGFLTSVDTGIKQGDLELATGELSSLIGRPTTPIVETLRTFA